jgi:hypothetical protein
MKTLSLLCAMLVAATLVSAQSIANLEYAINFRQYAENAVPVNPEGSLNGYVPNAVPPNNLNGLANANLMNNLNLNNANAFANTVAEDAVAVRINIKDEDAGNGERNMSLFAAISEPLETNDDGDIQPEVSTALYPNPATNAVTFEFELDEALDLRIVLYDGYGRPVRTIAPLLSHEKGVYTYRTSIVNLPSAMYFVRLESNHVVKTEKLIKQ